MTLNSHTIEQLVTQYLAFWGKADIDGLMSMYAQAMQYHDMPSGEVIDYPEIKQYLTDTFAYQANPILKVNESVFIEGNSAFIYWTNYFDATDTGKKATINGVELIVFLDGKIVSIHEFYDFRATETEPVSHPDKGTYQEKMAKLGLTDSMMQQLSEELSDYFDRDKPYLQPELTLATVSKHLGYTRNQISFVINHVLGRTFYDIVNVRRIEHAIQKMLLNDPNISILELGFDAGFNSVSGFYNAFRKQTNMTPAQYKKRIKASVIK